jgi:hypothetical protein
MVAYILHLIRKREILEALKTFDLSPFFRKCSVSLIYAIATCRFCLLFNPHSRLAFSSTVLFVRIFLYLLILTVVVNRAHYGSVQALYEVARLEKTQRPSAIERFARCRA